MASKIKTLSVVALLTICALVSINAVAFANTQSSLAPATAKPYSPLPGTLTLSTTSGPAGTIVTLTGSGYTASKVYSVYFDTTSGTSQYLIGYFTATSSGGILTNSTFSVLATVPEVAAGSYYIEAFNTTGALASSATYTVTASTATLSLSATSGAAGTSVTLTGTGYTPNQYYMVYLDTTSGTPVFTSFVVQFLSTSTGAIPSGTFGYIPAVAAGSYHLDVFYWETPLISSAAFTVS